MFCHKCGKEIPDGCAFCPYCAQTLPPVTAEYSSHPGAVGAPTAILVKKPWHRTKKFRLSILIVSALVLAFGLFLLIQGVGKANLQNDLMRGWSRVEEDEGAYYTLELDFSQDKIKYNFKSAYAWLDSTIGTYTYRVTAPDKIYVKEFKKTFIVEISRDKKVMTITPSITSTKPSESWFHH